METQIQVFNRLCALTGTVTVLAADEILMPHCADIGGREDYIRSSKEEFYITKENYPIHIGKTVVCPIVQKNSTTRFADSIVTLTSDNIHKYITNNYTYREAKDPTGYVNRYEVFTINAMGKSYTNILTGTVVTHTDANNDSTVSFLIDTDISDSISAYSPTIDRNYTYEGKQGYLRKRVIMNVRNIDTLEFEIFKVHP